MKQAALPLTHFARTGAKFARRIGNSTMKRLEEGHRLLSAYTAANGVKFWIITEWDRSATTILLPDDY